MDFKYRYSFKFNEFNSLQLFEEMIRFVTLVLISFNSTELVTVRKIMIRSSKIVETSIHSILFIQILVIDLDSTYSNESGSLTDLRLGISIQYPIIRYITRKNHAARRLETSSIRSDGC